MPEYRGKMAVGVIVSVVRTRSLFRPQGGRSLTDEPRNSF